MKKVFLLIVAGLMFVSCSKDDEAIIATSITENDIVGKWEVAHIEQSSNDTTEKLDGFVFDFKDDNKLMITNDLEGLSIEGSWSIMEVTNELKMLIPTKEDPLRMFHNEWSVDSLSGINISLSSLSNEHDGNMEHVNFEKL